MNKHLLIIAAMAFAVPTFRAAALEGEGTAENPYQISTVEDLKAIATVDQTDYSHYILMNDIDMTGVAWSPLFTDKTKDAPFGKIHFDGNCHVISNLKSNEAYASLFGQMDGTVKNLGLRDVSCVAAGKWDPAGAIAAYAGNAETFTADGCFVTGEVGGYYAGGVIGGTKVGATITNCYTDVKASGAGFSGGLCGAVNYRKIDDETGLDNILNVEYCFTVGNVSGDAAGGILGINQTYLHAATGSEILNVTNAVVMSELITGTQGAGAIACTTATPALVLNEENVLISDQTKVNGVAVEGGYAYEDLEKEICSWPAFVFNQEIYFPCLRWEVEGAAGISDIVVDNATDAPAVYYNLQGVQIANPENGIYIVRRGNKVTKQLVK